MTTARQRRMLIELSRDQDSMSAVEELSQKLALPLAHEVETLRARLIEANTSLDRAIGSMAFTPLYNLRSKIREALKETE